MSEVPDVPPAAEEPAVEEPVDGKVEIVDDGKAVDRELARLSRRGFLTAGIATAGMVAGWKWLNSRPQEDGLPWPLRRMLGINERIAEGYFSTARLSPTFSQRQVRPLRLNGNLGLDPSFDPASWQLRIEGAARPATLSMNDVRALPRHEQITEFRCIEGWSVIVHWTGARLADLMARFPPAQKTRFVSLETPDRGYYVGLDMASAVHPQTLLAYELNGEPLTRDHGAPLRLAIPVKYGIKNIKRIGTIRYTDVRPADFWAERGYDWYAGH